MKTETTALTVEQENAQELICPDCGNTGVVPPSATEDRLGPFEICTRCPPVAYYAILARKYCGRSIYCNSSTPSYSYIIAIPHNVRYRLQEAFRKALYPHCPPGEEYFLFECGPRPYPLIADGFEELPLAYAHGGWVRGDLVLAANGNLRMSFHWNKPWPKAWCPV